MLSTSQSKCAEAGPLFERTQTIREKVLGPEHEDVADVLQNRALLLRQQVRIDCQYASSPHFVVYAWKFPDASLPK